MSTQRLSFEAELSDGFWNTLLPQEMETSSSNSPYFLVYQAAQVKSNDKGFLSRDITVQDLILNRCDVHHLFPRKLLKDQGLGRGRYNQIANYALAQSEINIAIGHKPPETHFQEMVQQCNGGRCKYGAITDPGELKRNLHMHAIPEDLLNGGMSYEAFLDRRRVLMAQKIRSYFDTL